MLPSASLSEPQLQLAGRIDEERMQADVRALVALGPRMGGTPSGKAAVEWRRRRFEALGLKHEVVQGEPRWCHQAKSWKLTAMQGETRHELEGTWPWGFSPTSSGSAALGLQAAEGIALLVESYGYGRFRPQPRVLLVDGATTPDGRFPQVRNLRVRHGGPHAYPVFGLSRAQGQELRALIAAGPVTLDWNLESEIRQASPETVLARLPSGKPGAGFLLVCAHGDSDSGGPGANDNASGEAIVFEIARVLQAAHQAEEIQLGCEIRFALWGSEIHSTKHYLDQVIDKQERILGVLNFDQSGYGSSADRLYVEPDDLPANAAFVKRLARILAAGQGQAGFPKEWGTNRSVGGTDSYVFSSSRLFEERGLPAVTVYTSAWDREGRLPRTEGMPGASWTEEPLVLVDYDLHYHSAGDTPENTTDKEPWNMGWCARVGVLGAVRFAAPH